MDFFGKSSYQVKGNAVYQMDKLYEGQWDANYYFDLSVNYRINRPKVSHTFILQAKLA